MTKIKLRDVKHFVFKDLKGSVSADALISYLTGRGYTVVFYDDDNSLLKEYGVLEYSKTVNAFTLALDSQSFVFVKDGLSPANTLYSLLHETAHIFLGHLKTNNKTFDTRYGEMEAEAFSYAALQVKKSKIPFVVLFAICITFLVYSILIPNLNVETKTTTPQAPVVTIKPIITTEPMGTDIVFITPTGTKYHRPSCRYVKNKNCIKLEIAEAIKKYTPCSVCNP